MTDELIQKLSSATTLEEAKAFVKDNCDSLTDEEKAAFESSINKLNEERKADSGAEMSELSDEELDNVVGGALFKWTEEKNMSCPKCKRKGTIKCKFVLLTNVKKCTACGFLGCTMGFIDVKPRN